VKLTVFVRDMGNLPLYRRARNRFFASVTPPAAAGATLVEVSRLFGEDVVAEIQRRWAEAFARADPGALASLYAEDALFFGSMPDLYRQRSGVQLYFETLPSGYEGAAFGETHAVEINPELMISAGFVTFTAKRDGDHFSLLYRMSWTLVRSRGEWKILSHHASPKNPAELPASVAADMISARSERLVRGVTATARHER
jgi:ketosteroid isomerase-like protein